jgi:hypothetical protein
MGGEAVIGEFGGYWHTDDADRADLHGYFLRKSAGICYIRVIRVPLT